jgi:uncharacterized protein (TIGR02300 family)
MPELKLGNKFECYNCSTKFYDLGKSEALCPKCGADQKNASQHESPATTPAARKRRKAEVLKPVEVEEEETIEELPEDEIATPELEGSEAEEEEDDLDDDE